MSLTDIPGNTSPINRIKLFKSTKVNLLRVFILTAFIKSSAYCSGVAFPFVSKISRPATVKIVFRALNPQS